jgi:hypothetical protein
MPSRRYVVVYDLLTVKATPLKRNARVSVVHCGDA